MLRNFSIIFVFFYSCECIARFELYTRSNPDQNVIVYHLNSSNSSFDYSKESKLIVHGFSSSGLALLRIKTELLKRYDMNIIAVDWKAGAKAPNYFLAAKNSKKVGDEIAKFLEINKIDQSRIHCIGHSLGAHACGFAGKIKKLGRISGLDPAGPLFEKKAKNERLDKEDADFVDIIHTDFDLGIQKPIGHCNFYPNGGKKQAGCLFRSIDLNNTTDDNESIKLQIESKGEIVSIFSCSHSRAHLLYAESISKCSFKSIPCSNYEDFKKGKCQLTICAFNYAGCAPMGYNSNKYHLHGNHYLDTTKTPPYC